MALHKLVVEVVDGGRVYGGTGGATGDTSPTEKQPKKKSVLYRVLNYDSEIKEAMTSEMSPAGQMAFSSSIAIAKQAGRSAFNYWVNDIGRKNGDSNYQAQINREIEKVTDITSVIGAGVSGAAAGLAFGGIGAVVGAVIGVTSAGISNSFKYAERERTFAHEMFKQNNSQAVQLARANYSALTGRPR